MPTTVRLRAGGTDAVGTRRRSDRASLPARSCRSRRERPSRRAARSSLGDAGATSRISSARAGSSMRPFGDGDAILVDVLAVDAARSIPSSMLAAARRWKLAPFGLHRAHVQAARGSRRARRAGGERSYARARGRNRSSIRSARTRAVGTMRSDGFVLREERRDTTTACGGRRRPRPSPGRRPGRRAGRSRRSRPTAGGRWRGTGTGRPAASAMPGQCPIRRRGRPRRQPSAAWECRHPARASGPAPSLSGRRLS